MSPAEASWRSVGKKRYQGPGSKEMREAWTTSSNSTLGGLLTRVPACRGNDVGCLLAGEGKMQLAVFSLGLAVTAGDELALESTVSGASPVDWHLSWNDQVPAWAPCAGRWRREQGGHAGQRS